MENRGQFYIPLLENSIKKCNGRTSRLEISARLGVMTQKGIAYGFVFCCTLPSDHCKHKKSVRKGLEVKQSDSRDLEITSSLSERI